MVGDYRKLSTHNQLRQEPEIKTRVKLFKGKGRWLTTLLVAVGAAVAVQGRATAHAATTSTTDADPETVASADDTAVAVQTEHTVKLAVSPKATDSSATSASGVQSVKPAGAATATPSDQSADSTEAVATATQPNATPAAATNTTSPSDATPPNEVVAPAPVEQPAKSIDPDDNQGQAGQSEQKAPSTATTQNSAPQSNPQIGATDAEQSPEPTKTQTVENTSTKPATTEGPQFKTAVAAAVGTEIDTVTFTPIAKPSDVSVSRVIENNGKSYTFQIQAAHTQNQATLEDNTWGFSLFNNTVTDAANPDVAHTYVYLSGYTSAYYMRDLSKSDDDYDPLAVPLDEPASQAYEQGTAADGTPYVRLTTTDDKDQLLIIETVSIDASGAFNHTVSIKNTGSSALNKVKFGTMLDTALDTDDQIPVISNGDGSAYITNNTSASGVTLYLTPTDKDSLFVGQWRNPSSKDYSGNPIKHGDILGSKPATGTDAGSVLEAGVDTAVQYETSTLSLAPGASISYSYSEHLYTEPVTTSTINVKYQDDEGNALKPDTTTSGVVGSPFVLSSDAKTIDGYTYVRTDGGVTAFTKDAQTVTLIFGKNQNATVTYEDTTDNKTLGDVDEITGASGSTSDYSTAARIQEYLDQGYKLVSDDTAGGIVFDKDDNTDQPFVVKLEHNVVPISPKEPHDGQPSDFTSNAKRTINYVMASDGSQVSEPKEQPVSFSRTGTEDLVTHEIKWGDWQAQSVNEVISPTIAGYTPDQATVPADSLMPGGNKTITVKYVGDVQNATITYQDVTDNNKTLSDVDTTTGASGSTSGYSTAARIQEYLDQGYKLVSDDTAGGIVFDKDDNTDQPFVVKLEHNIVPVSPKEPHDAQPNDFTGSAERTINYVMASDGSQVSEPKEQAVSFSRTGMEDLVTHEIKWGDWQAQSINEVISPTIAGYTPDKATVPAGSLMPGDNKTITVKYVGDDQNATITYQDVTDNNKTLGDVDKITGASGTTSTYSTAARIQEYLDQGYKLVSDDTTGGIVFDKDDNTDQPFVVKLEHNIVPVSPKEPHDGQPSDFTNSAKRTINYVMASDGSQVSEPKEQAVSFSRTGMEDLVTHEIKWGDWQAQPVNEVISPTIAGYTPDQTTVPADSLMPGDAKVVTVKYTANTQTALVIYVDELGNHLIANQPIADKSDTPVDNAQIQGNIQDVINQGYNLVTNGTVGAVFDRDDGQSQIFVVVFSKIPAPQTTPGQTGGYVPTPPTGNPDPGDPGLPSTFGGKTPNEPNQPQNNDDDTPNEPELPSTFGDTTNGKSETTVTTRLAATDQKTVRPQAKTAVGKSSANKTLPQTGDERAGSLAWLGATMMLLLSLVGWRRKQ